MSNYSDFLKRKFIYFLIASGFLGFCITLFVYVGSRPLQGSDKSYTFHEIAFNRNRIIDSFNKAYLDTVEPTFKRYQALRKKVLEDSSLKITDSSAVHSRQTEKSLEAQLHINNDSDRNALIQFLSLQKDAYRKYRPGKIIKIYDSIEAKSKLAKLNTDKNSNVLLNFLMIDSTNKDFPLRKKITLHTFYYRHNIDFFEKYPDFGLWILFTCATVAVWFILTVIFFADIFNYYSTVNDYYTDVSKVIPEKILKSLGQKIKKTRSGKQSLQILSIPKLTGFLIYAFILVGIFIGIQFITVYDHSVIPVSLFTENYRAKFIFFLITGGITSSFFFGGYLAMGEVLKEITLLTAFINKERAASVPDENRKHDLDAALDALCKMGDLSLKNLNKYFYITSFILTAVVIVTGVLFSGINSLDIAKLYNESFNANFLNYDIIYLFGGLYSLLILFFYLPLRLTFSQVRERYPEAHAQATGAEPDEAAKGQTNQFAYLQNPNFLNRLKETFAVSTPLLAAIIQMLIDIFSNK